MTQGSIASMRESRDAVRELISVVRYPFCVVRSRPDRRTTHHAPRTTFPSPESFDPVNHRCSQFFRRNHFGTFAKGHDPAQERFTVGDRYCNFQTAILRCPGGASPELSGRPPGNLGSEADYRLDRVVTAGLPGHRIERGLDLESRGPLKCVRPVFNVDRLHSIDPIHPLAIPGPTDEIPVAPAMTDSVWGDPAILTLVLESNRPSFRDRLE